MALSFFPRPYPDEIMYSLIARYHHISGNQLKADTIKDLFNCSRIWPSIALQSKLGFLADNCKRFGTDFDTLLLGHTMFPYIMVFMTQERYERVLNWAKYSDNYFDRAGTGMINRNIYPDKLMYCAECVKEDILLLGEAYWHRIHQTPGIVLCKKHHCSLSSSSIRTFNHMASNYQVLQQKVMQVSDPTIQKHCNEDFIYSDKIFDDTKFLYDNFVRVRKLFSDYGYSFHDAFFPELINKQLAKKGFLKHRELIAAIIDFYGADYLSRIGLSISDSLGIKWPIHLCRKGGRHHAFALEYILMARFLFGSFENFIYETENRTRFSISTKPIKAINQIILERYRSKWLELISQMPDKGRMAVRNLDNATYTWLQRHDDKWLKEHLPEKKLSTYRVNNNFYWSERDKALSKQVELVVESLKYLDGKPKRITQSRICIELHCKDMFHANKNKLPLTSLAIKNAVETLEQFRLRQCNWIIDLLQKEGIHPTPQKVYAMLGLRNQNEWKKIIDSILKEKGY